MSLTAITPVAQMQAANATLEEAGFGPRNFTVPAYSGTGASHATLHAWEDAAFRAALEAIPEVTILEPEEGEELPTDPIAMTQALIEAQGAQWGDQAPPLTGNVLANTLYRHTDDSLWWTIQPYNADTYPDPTAIPALVRRARRPGVAEPWAQPPDSLNAYRLIDPFTGQAETCTHNGKEWFVSQGDGSGNNIWEPGTFGWTEKGQTPVIQPEPQPGPQAWAIGQSVAVGDLRRHNGKVWKAKVAHVTHAGWEPSAAAWAVWELQA